MSGTVTQAGTTVTANLAVRPRAGPGNLKLQVNLKPPRRPLSWGPDYYVNPGPGLLGYYDIRDYH